MKNNIIVFIVLLAIFYLLGCFVEVTFDIAAWEPLTRYMIGIIGLVVSAIIAATYNDN